MTVSALRLGRLRRAPAPSTRRITARAVRRRRRRVVKRAFDVSVTLSVALLVLPVALLCALLIWIDSPGPILMRQYRTGYRGNRFAMFKFRTMVANAEELKASLAHLNVLPPPDFKIPNDPRITRVGRFLRKTSLDEVPQLLNVLRGDMSLVGPRPTSFAVHTYRLWHTERLEAVPGITGLWQVKARGSSTFDERLRLDIEYIDRQSMLLDLKIILMTIGSVFARTGA
jgi:lipopolysaccharide/colanic/teichoic acid biosynthesis glycosyltransferase